MKKWTTEVHLANASTGETRVIVPDGDDTEEMVLALVAMNARFVLDGVKYWGGKPTVDPINRVIRYYCEGYSEC